MFFPDTNECEGASPACAKAVNGQRGTCNNLNPLTDNKKYECTCNDKGYRLTADEDCEGILMFFFRFNVFWLYFCSTYSPNQTMYICLICNICCDSLNVVLVQQPAWPSLIQLFISIHEIGTNDIVL